MQKIIGHHTCENTGNGTWIEQQGAPVAKSHYKEGKQKNPFLGSGYYFWDYNMVMARNWGEKHYGNKYYIFQADIHSHEDILFDLVGNRQHQEAFREVVNELLAYDTKKNHWSIGAVIEYLKKYTDFPFKAIRAEDRSVWAEKYYFDDSTHRFTHLDPRNIVCITNVSPEVLTNFKLIETK